jgi:xanthine dehydrogenase YagS FAD-binding subunit
MSLPEFDYYAPSTLKDALGILGRYGEGAKVIAGGSDLLHLMKRGAIVPSPEVIVDIKRVGGLGSLEFDPAKGLSIGSVVTVSEVGSSDLVAEHYPLLTQTVDYISSPQVRNVATVGGALTQQVWCWFLRNGLRCWRAGGETCFATQEGADDRYYHSVMGGDPCLAVHPSDLAVALEALDATVLVAGPNGTKEMSVADFIPGNVWIGNALQSHALSPSEIVTGVSIPPPPAGVLSVFIKARVRNAFDFAIASVAITLTVSQGSVQDSRVVFGGVAPSPYRDAAAERSLIGKVFSTIDPVEAAAVALDGAAPLQNNAYKVDVAKGILKQGLLDLLSQE